MRTSYANNTRQTNRKILSTKKIPTHPMNTSPNSYEINCKSSLAKNMLDNDRGRNKHRLNSTNKINIIN